MNNYAYIRITINGSVELIESNKREFELDEFYQGIDCDCIGIVGIKPIPEVLMVIDDNGKVFHKPINPLATALYGQYPMDFIVGDVILGVRDMIPEPDVYKFPISEAKRIAEYLVSTYGR